MGRAEESTPVGDWRPKHLSYSAVSKFTECPYDYWLSYVKGKRSPSNKGMLIGSLFGQLIEQLHNERPVSFADLERYHAKLNFYDREKVGKAELKTVWTLLGLYAEADDDESIVLEDERDLVFTTPPYRGNPEHKLLVWLPDRTVVPYQILGYMDLERPQDNAISEFKTSAWIDHPDWGWHQAKVDDSDQASVYWYAYGLEHDREPDEVRFHALGTRPPCSYRELVTKPTMERLLRFQDRAAALCEAIETETFPCQCGKHVGKS